MPADQKHNLFSELVFFENDLIETLIFEFSEVSQSIHKDGF